MTGRYTKRLLVSCATGAFSLVLHAPAFAADAGAGQAAASTAAPATVASDPQADKEAAIVVTGLRGSLQRNLDLKKNALGVLDAISAEDIGKFPDPNVAASLQRLPGVTVQLSGVRGEATGVTVRGFSGDFNETLYDGRHISTATGNRAVDFSTVGSDFVGQISVYKTPDVSVSSSAIGATIDIAFPKPFDHPGFHMATSLSGTLQDRSGKAEPSAALLVSDTFANGTMGILADVAYSRHETTTNHVYVNGWEGGYYAPCQLAGSTATNCSPATAGAGVAASNAETVLGWFPQQAGAEQARTRDERIDARLAYQWRPSDKILLTVDDNFSSQIVETDTYGYAAWFNMSQLTNVKQDANGTAIDFNQPGTPMDMNAGIAHSLIDVNQLGVNLKYEATDHLKFDFDAATSKSWLNPNGEIGNNSSDIGYGGTLGANTGLAVNGPSSSSLPTLHDIGPNGNESQFLDTSLIGSHVMVRQAQQNTDRVRQFRFKGSWEQDGMKVQFGASYKEDTFHLQERDTFTNNFWQAYAGYGSPSGRSTGVLLPSSIYGNTISTANFIPGYSGTLAPGILSYNPIAVYNYLQGLGNPQTTNIPGYNYGCCGTAYTGTLDLALSPSSVALITEKTWAAYVRGSFENEIASMPFHFSSGLRFENTDLNTVALGQSPVALETSSADPTLLTTQYANNGATQTIIASHSYNYLLPSLDMKLDVTGQLHLRFDASRTLTRPALTALNPVLSVGSGQRVGALTATGGNPNLQPYLSDNYDLAAEWYFAPNSYLSIDGFLKHVSNFIVNGVQRQTINGVIDPTTGQPAQFAVSQEVNGPDATVHGVEIALQEVIGHSGFGFTLNGTFVGTNKPYNPQDISTSGFAVTGLANSANLVAFYDKHGFQARVAVNWRDSYLLQFGQNQNTGQFGAEPTFVNSQIQVDLSSSYDVTRQATVFGGITNLNNSVYSTHGRFSNQLLDAYAYGRRFTFGVRYHF